MFVLVVFRSRLFECVLRHRMGNDWPENLEQDERVVVSVILNEADRCLCIYAHIDILIVGSMLPGCLSLQL